MTTEHQEIYDTHITNLKAFHPKRRAYKLGLIDEAEFLAAEKLYKAGIAFLDAGYLKEKEDEINRISAREKELEERVKTLEDGIRSTRYWQDVEVIKALLEQALAAK